MRTPTYFRVGILLLSLTALAQQAQPPFRCGTPDRDTRLAMFGPSTTRAGADCSDSLTNPTSAYAPVTVYEIPVVVHIIMDNNGVGAISDAMVESQIDILNEDFLALVGTNGAPGTYTAIQFRLATEDPNGNPTTGITRSNNTTWFNDGGSYYNTLNWDPNRYMNIYTNLAGGNLGYVPFLPADGNGAFVGTAADRVVILWDTFGRNAPSAPFNLGRTATHEVGHYLGLEHTFNGGCSASTAPGCYSGGDLICDTLPESAPNFGDCSGGDPASCGNADPIHNYMDYSDDACMWEFSPEQTRRMRCSLESWRSNLYSIPNSCAGSTLAASAGNDTSICVGGSTQLNASATGGVGSYVYSWSPTTGLNNPNIANPTASPTSTETYTVTVQDQNSCESTASVIVSVVPADNTVLPIWQNSGSFSQAYDLDADGFISILDIIALWDSCL